MALPAIFPTQSLDASAELPESSVRLRLVSCRVEHHRGATTRATVECHGPAAGQRTTGLQQGSSCPGGDLRLTALAALDAVTQATAGAMRFELIGVKPMRAFDTNLVVVAIVAHHDGQTTRLVGSAMADEDPVVGTARATLHAINRLAAPLLARLLV
jgi:hypothetical protein